MGRLTSEKIEQIRRTYRKNKSYSKTAEIEGVDKRTVGAHVKEKSTTEGNDPPRAIAENQPVQDRLQNPNDVRANASASQNPSTTTGAQNTPVQNTEPKVFEFYDKGGTPMQAIIKFNISSELAERIFTRFLQLKFYERVPEQLEGLDGDTIRNLLRLDMHRRERNLDIDRYASRIEQFGMFLDGRIQLTQVNAELKEGQGQLRNVRESIASSNKQKRDAELDLNLIRRAKADEEIALSEVTARKNAVMHDIQVLRDEQLMPAIRKEGAKILGGYEYVVKGTMRASMDAVFDIEDFGILICQRNTLKNGMAPPEQAEAIKQQIERRIEQSLRKAMDMFVIDLLQRSFQWRTRLGAT